MVKIQPGRLLRYICTAPAPDEQYSHRDYDQSGCGDAADDGPVDPFGRPFRLGLRTSTTTGVGNEFLRFTRITQVTAGIQLNDEVILLVGLPPLGWVIVIASAPGADIQH